MSFDLASPISARRRSVADYLRSQPNGSFASELRKALGIKKGTLNSDLRALRDEGVVAQPHGHGTAWQHADLPQIDRRSAVEALEEARRGAWTTTDQVLRLLVEHPGGLISKECAAKSNLPVNVMCSYLSHLARRGDAVKIGGRGGKWYASQHAPEPVTA